MKSKHLTFHEVESLASEAPLFVSPDNGLCIKQTTDDKSREMIACLRFMGSPNLEGQANAALLVHCRNKFVAMMNALESISNCCWISDAQVIALRALADAEQVEIDLGANSPF